MRLLACIDGSDHDAAVCDYAAWLSGPTEHEIDLLHAIEGDSDAAFENAERSLSAATARLSDCGLETLRRVTQRGAFLEVAETMTSGHSILVVEGEGRAIARTAATSDLT